MAFGGGVSSPVLNGLDHLKGMLCKVEVAAWAAGGAGPSFAWTDQGEAVGVDLKVDQKSKQHRVDNAREVLDEYITEEDVTIAFELTEASLVKLALARGEVMATSGSPLIQTSTKVVTGTGTATYSFGPISGDQYYAVRLTVVSQAMKPLGGTGDTYAGRSYVLHKVHFSGSINHKLIRSEHAGYGVKGTVIRDTSVTAITGTTDQYGYVKDMATAQITG